MKTSSFLGFVALATINFNVAARLQDVPEGAKPVIGRAHAVDLQRQQLTTLFCEDDMLSLWSKGGWRNGQVVYLIHDSSVPTRHGQLPYWDGGEEKVIWRGEKHSLPANLLPVLVWKVRGLKELAEGADAAVELNVPGTKIIERLLTTNFLVLEGIPPGVKQAYVLSSDQVRQNRAELKASGAVLVRVDKNGFVINTYDFDLRPSAKKMIDFRLFFSRPSWYPRYQPGA